MKILFVGPNFRRISISADIHRLRAPILGDNRAPVIRVKKFKLALPLSLSLSNLKLLS